MYAQERAPWNIRPIALGSILLIGLAYALFRSEGRPDKIGWDYVRDHFGCTPERWSQGSWQPRELPANASTSTIEEIYKLAGYPGCVPHGRLNWDFDWYPMTGHLPPLANQEWIPGCQIEPINPFEMLQSMVTRGGWLLIGDSITMQHALSISCILFPHLLLVEQGEWDWNFYLNPASSFVNALIFPSAYNITHTPLLTFFRTDLFLSAPELEGVFLRMPDELVNHSLPLKGAEWTRDIEPMTIQNAISDSSRHYGLVLASTGGHWTTPAFNGRDLGVVAAIFSNAIEYWLESLRAIKTDIKIVVKAYNPGHSNCSYSQPLLKSNLDMSPWRDLYNWATIPQYNAIFKNLIASERTLDITYMDITRPGDLRPDAHKQDVEGHQGHDCLHWNLGSGVVEDWTRFLWHFVKSSH